MANPQKISVTVRNGYVSLHGVVPTYSQLRIAENDARNVVGAGWVSSFLEVNPDWREDAAIYSDLEFEIDNDYVLNGQNINFRVKDGAVTLSGDANTFHEKTHAGDVYIGPDYYRSQKRQGDS